MLNLHLKPAPSLSLSQAAVQVLLILTGRTTRKLPYETSALRSVTSGHVLHVDEKTSIVELALPTFLCRPSEGLTHFMTLICSAAEYNYCDEYWVENVDFPQPYVDAFKGPRFGVDGLRHLLGPDAQTRPLVGVMLKPRLGVPLTVVADHIRNALIGGCDFVVDDLLLVDPEGDYSIDHRLKVIGDVIRDVKAEVGSTRGYLVNVGASPAQALRASQKALDAGAMGLVANGFSMGFGGLSDLIDALGGRAPVITCNMGGGILTRPRLLNTPGKPTGLSETVISKLSRLAGADAVHAGTSASECYGTDAWGPATRALQNHFFGKAPCFAVAEGDLNIANLWENIFSLGTNVILEPTSGILAAPGGSRNAATVFRELAERLSDDMSEVEAKRTIEDYALKRKPLGVQKMLDHFGYRRAESN